MPAIKAIVIMYRRLLLGLMGTIHYDDILSHNYLLKRDSMQVKLQIMA